MEVRADVEAVMRVLQILMMLRAVQEVAIAKEIAKKVAKPIVIGLQLLREWGDAFLEVNVAVFGSIASHDDREGGSCEIIKCHAFHS